ncbi:MAG: coenzyme F420-0:L-glutamate ligase [Chloroflexi bacterium]|nr:coenzyme F420-0:L-glutamate ligase [Chloroflexota bacterium]
MVCTGITGLPMIQTGDDLASLIAQRIRAMGMTLKEGDVMVVAQKIVSKAEGRWVHLSQVTPSPQAVELARLADKDPRLVELILQESREILRVRPGLIIVEHRLGFVCANAGIDHSNVKGDDEWVLLLPEDPDRSARALRAAWQEAFGVDNVAVIINDSHGRAWRLGTVGVAIGLAGLHPLTDRRGDPDLTGRTLHVTVVGTADELAAAASAVMGQADEAIPAVHIRGARFQPGDGRLQDLLRPKERDLFR